MNWLPGLMDLGSFVIRKKRLVLAPLLVLLLVMALFILLAEIPVLTPFIYALF